NCGTTVSATSQSLQCKDVEICVLRRLRNGKPCAKEKPANKTDRPSYLLALCGQSSPANRGRRTYEDVLEQPTKPDRAPKKSAFHGRFFAHGALAAGFCQPFSNRLRFGRQFSLRALLL